MPRGAQITAVVRALFTVEVSVGLADPRRLAERAHPEEERAIATARAPRQQEFRAGRQAIARAMQARGIAPRPVPAGPDRAPVWPDGLAGSLTHCEDLCIAVLSGSEQALALGIDAEPSGAVTPDLWPGLFTQCERARLRQAARPDLAATALFTAKEAAYKAQYPLSRQLLAFTDIEIGLSDAARFDAVFQRAAGPFGPGDVLTGRWAQFGGLHLAGVTVPVPPRKAPDR